MTSVSTHHPFSGIPVTRHVPAIVTAIVRVIVSIVADPAVESSQMRIAAKRNGRNCLILAVPDVGTQTHIGPSGPIAVDAR